MRTSLTPPCFFLCLYLLVAGCATPPLIGEIAQQNDEQAGKLTLQNNKTYPVRPDALSYTGFAYYQYPDGSVYEGEFVAGKRQGNGHQILPSDEEYEGEWHQDQREGQGAIIVPDHSIYTGTFRNNRRAGFGIQTSPSGRYEGDWLANVPHGFGNFTGVAGLEYVGEWKGGKRTGYGLGVTRSKSQYEGMWHENKRSGYGEEIRLDGSRYRGDWADNKREGQGVSSQPNGSLHDGEWAFNAPLGAGTHKDENGVQLTGMWSGSTLRAGLVQLSNKQSYAGLLYNPRKQGLNPHFLSWITEQAETGNAQAQLMLGEAYSDYSLPKPDRDKARHWFELAANQNIVEGKYRLAVLYLKNSENAQQAVNLLSEAAEQQHAPSNLKLATLYDEGEHVDQSMDTAIKFYAQASDLGNLQARNKLAWIFATSSSERNRDANKALELVKPLAYLFDTWPYLETLAAALAETGNYSNAVSVQQKAIVRAENETDPAILARLNRSMNLYKAEKTIRSN